MTEVSILACFRNDLSRDPKVLFSLVSSYPKLMFILNTQYDYIDLGAYARYIHNSIFQVHCVYI